MFVLLSEVETGTITASNPSILNWSYTKSFLTTTLITSATGAVITAAAGNRLALQLVSTNA